MFDLAPDKSGWLSEHFQVSWDIVVKFIFSLADCIASFLLGRPRYWNFFSIIVKHIWSIL
jgi:hypothetical protein